MWAWALLPIFLAVWAIVGVWIVYAMAVSNGSVNLNDGFPVISTCGSYPPQSCIFGQVLNVGAFLAVWILVMRFQQIRDYGCHSHLNSVSLAIGCFCALGTSLVANFQQSIQLETHLAGAFLAFFFGNIYFWMQTVLTYKVEPRHGGRWIVPTRFILSMACTVFNVLMVVFFTQNMKSLAAICEWVVAMIIFVLFGLFSVEFWHLDMMSLHVQKRRTAIPNEMQVSTITLQ
ncbi:modulator of macroautophagy TMEM150B-like [Bombina bombina]|uniref:modulator of macroautophagy TMEM150B-like n=1 Tax=Bombina bombina TaxID=8345 RepID=UPI00235B1B71|nr:modulator of macroautophagy TMEM150B-like [Bombina bombina]